MSSNFPICIRAVLALAPALLIALPPVRAQTRAARPDGAAKVALVHGVLGEGESWETPFVVVRSASAGPTVLVVGGVHGNEPAGAMATEQIAGWKITRGRLVVVPRANTRALAARQRRTPGVARTLSDLNRQFPTDRPARTETARALWALLEQHEPDVLVDLHEGYDYHRENGDSVGSSVIAGRTDDARDLARKLVETVDATITVESKRFSLLGPPVAGSLARKACVRRGVTAMILETTTKGRSAAYRARQHRILVHRLLDELRMAAHGPHVLVGTAGGDGDVAVAMYVSGGVGGPGPDRIQALLDEEHGFDLRRVCATDVRTGVLGQFDVVVFPGGSGSGQAKALRSAGRESVRAFVEAGGGYIGVCGGAYLASAGYEWSLGILDAVVIDRAHWRRGVGTVTMSWTADGRRRASSGREAQSVRYANGPLYAPALDDTIPDYEVWAVYDSEMNRNGAPEGIMLGTPAVVFGHFGTGRVVGVGPHPEQTDGSEEIVRRLALRAAGR